MADKLNEGWKIVNVAVGGKTVKTIQRGKVSCWQKAQDAMHPGDFVIVQFGINDGAFSMKDRYCPTCGKVPRTSGSFEWQ